MHMRDTNRSGVLLSHTLLGLLDILVAKADVLRLEDLSVRCFAADDDIQLVYRLYHSSG